MSDKIFCTTCGTEIESPEQGFFCGEACREEVQEPLQRGPIIPQRPEYPWEAQADEEVINAYYAERDKVNAWCKSPHMDVALTTTVADNDLRGYLKLQSLYMGTPGLGAKGWREKVDALLQAH